MPYSLSSSTLSLFKQCPRCFWLLLKKDIARPASIYPSLPYGIDKVLKQRFDYFRGKEKLPIELRILGNGFKLCDHPLLALWRDARQGLRWKDAQGNVLRGAVDDVLQRGEKLMVLEYVTRGFELKDDTAKLYQDQVSIYSYLLQKNGFATEAYAYVLFYYPKGVNWRGDVWFHKQLEKIPVSISVVDRLLNDAIAVLEGKMPLSAERCEFCRWGKVL